MKRRRRHCAKKQPDLYVVMILPDKSEHPVVGAYIAGEQWYQLSQLWAVAKDRVRVYVMYKKHPVTPATYVNVYVHAKIAIVDDLWMTIGSANTNNRSMVLDTECNITVAHRDVVKEWRKRAWKEMLADSAGETDDPILGIRTGWIPRGERNAALMEQQKELEGYIVPLKAPKTIRRIPESLRLLL